MNGYNDMKVGDLVRVVEDDEIVEVIYVYGEDDRGYCTVRVKYPDGQVEDYDGDDDLEYPNDSR